MLTNEIPVDWNETRNVSVCASRSPNRLEKDIVVQLAIRDVNTICKFMRVIFVFQYMNSHPF